MREQELSEGWKLFVHEALPPSLEREDGAEVCFMSDGALQVCPPTAAWQREAAERNAVRGLRIPADALRALMRAELEREDDPAALLDDVEVHPAAMPQEHWERAIRQSLVDRERARAS